MRGHSLLMLSLVLFLPCEIFAQNGPTKAGLRDWDKYQRSKKRRIEVRPIQAGVGISSGIVIAFGHPISPPYKFEYADRKLLVNGIQLIPSPLSEKENAEVKKLLTSDVKERLAAYSSVRKSARAMFARGESPEAILEFLLSNDHVIHEAKWTSEKTVQIRLRGEGHFRHAITFRNSSPNTTKRAIEANDKKLFRKRRLEQLEGALLNGMVLIFLSDNGVYRSAATNIPSRIASIMSATDLSEEGRIDSLSELLGGSKTAAYDIIANYSEQEWKNFDGK